MSEPEEIFQLGSSTPILVYPPATDNKVTFNGHRAQIMVLDEGMEITFTPPACGHADNVCPGHDVAHQQCCTLCHEAKRPVVAPKPEPPKPEPPTMPPHASYPSLNAKVHPGDEIVVTFGDQRGWRGRVVSSDATTISASMTKPDGSKANNGMPVKHKAQYVAKVLITPPPFASPDEAEAWLAAMDREVRPAYVLGQTVQFERQVRVKKRGVKPVQKRVLTGKVVGFKPDAHVENSPTGRGPSYRVLTLELPMNDGWPTILWVEPACIVSG